MRVEDVVRAMEPWRAANRRIAWHPVVRSGQEGAGSSRFGGLPNLAEGEPWPGCEVCWGPLTHILQLDLAEVPGEAGVPPGRGLLQVFVCTAGCLYDWERNGRHGPANRAGLVRVIAPAPAGKAPTTPGVAPLPPWAVVGWERVVDYPDAHDHEALGLVYDYLWAHRSLRLEWPQGGLTFEWVEGGEGVAEAISDARPGHKLRGWPAWVRSPRRPDCAHCGSPMGFVLQVEGDSGMPGYFALGPLYVWQCAAHPNTWTFSHDS